MISTAATPSGLILPPIPHRYCHSLNTPLISNSLFPLVSAPLAAAHLGAARGGHGGVPGSTLPANPQSVPPQCPHRDAPPVDVGRATLWLLPGRKEPVGIRRVARGPAVEQAGTRKRASKLAGGKRGEEKAV